LQKKLAYIFNIDNSLAITTPDMEEMLQKLNYDFKKEALEQKNKQSLNLSLFRSSIKADTFFNYLVMPVRK
jgi:hypothetical protein